MNLYRNESSNPKWNAQRNLEGRTHYVDDDTLRFHHSRILNAFVTDNGLIFSLIESYAADMNNTKRMFRPVVFDVTGTVIERPEINEGFRTSKQAIDAMWDILNKLDAIEVTEQAIQSFEKQAKREAQYMREDLARIQKRVA